MTRSSVNSSNIASAGYDEESRTLEIEFSNGSVYQYFDVPGSVYDGLMGSPSPGRYVNMEIKNAYRYEAV